VIVLGLSLALTLYAMFTRKDFKKRWGTAIVISVALIFFGIFALIGWVPILNSLYCSLGLILFGIYIVFDLQ